MSYRHLSLFVLSLGGLTAHAEGKLALPLDHLQLTPTEVRARDARVMPIIQATFESKTAIGSVVNAIETEYALNVFHEGIDKSDLKTKRGVMTAYIYDLLGKENPLEGVMESERPYRGTLRSLVGIDYGRAQLPVALPALSRTDLKNLANCRQDLGLCYTHNWSMIFTDPEAIRISGRMKDRYAAASSLSTPLSAYDKPLTFLRALRDSQIRALDATLVLTSSTNSLGEVGNTSPNTRVIYPTFSRYAPIPTPLIVVNAQATRTEIERMLRQEAPKIYAYNQLLEQSLMPTPEDLDEYLAKYPAVSDAVKQVIRTADRARMRAYMMDVFLTTSYYAFMGIAVPVAVVGTVGVGAAAGAVALPVAALGALPASVAIGVAVAL